MMNSILLYELRQSVRNRSVLVAMMLYLAVMVALTGFVHVGGITINDYWQIVRGIVVYADFEGPPNRQLVTALFLTYTSSRQ